MFCAIGWLISVWKSWVLYIDDFEVLIDVRDVLVNGFYIIYGWKYFFDILTLAHSYMKTWSNWDTIPVHLLNVSLIAQF